MTTTKERTYHRVRVTLETEYLVPDYMIAEREGGLDALLKEWFERFDLNDYHASRDGSEVGGAKRILKVESQGPL